MYESYYVAVFCNLSIFHNFECNLTISIWLQVYLLLYTWKHTLYHLLSALQAYTISAFTGCPIPSIKALHILISMPSFSSTIVNFGLSFHQNFAVQYYKVLACVNRRYKESVNLCMSLEGQVDNVFCSDSLHIVVTIVTVAM